jgi:hypothetical protein
MNVQTTSSGIEKDIIMDGAIMEEQLGLRALISSYTGFMLY